MKPDVPRPYRAWGYPVTPAIFVASTSALLLNTFLERPRESIVGVGLVASGLLVYWHKHGWPSGVAPQSSHAVE